MNRAARRRDSGRSHRVAGAAAAALVALLLSGGAARALEVLVDFEGEEFAGPADFTGAEVIESKGATFSGGQALTEARNLLANRTTVYGTSGRCPGCSRTLVIEFDEPVSDVAFGLFNGTGSGRPFLVADNTGRVTRVFAAPRARRDVVLPGGNVTRLTVRATFGAPTFFIDDLAFEVPDRGFTVSFSAFVPHDHVPAGPTARCLGRPLAVPPGLLARGVPDTSRARWRGDASVHPAAARGNGNGRGADLAAAGIPRGRPFGFGGPTGPQPLYFAGDDRGFAADAPTFRLRQVVTVVTDAVEDSDGLKEGSVQNLTRELRAFAADALADDGAITAADEDGVANDCHMFHRAHRSQTDGMAVEVTRIGPHAVEVRLAGTLETPLAGPARVLGAIDWDITVTIDKSDGTARWTVSGAHDGFPAFELYVNGVEIYRMDPGAPPYRFSRHLRRLLPPLDARIAARSGTLP